MLRGRALPLGATPGEHGVNFAVFSSVAESVHLLLFAPGGATPLAEIALDPEINRTGDVWHVFVGGVGGGIEYAFRVASAEAVARSSVAAERVPGPVLLDPYAKSVAGAESWRDANGGFRARRGRVVADDFDWEDEKRPERHMADSVLYELHVRGFTAHASAGTAALGTFRALIEKIPYLLDLGVTAVELLPVTDFEENDNRHVDPRTGQRLVNFWGYAPLAFFAPKQSYAAERETAGEVREFKEMVKAFHEAGIEVILDMVLNHTGEVHTADDRHTVSFRGLDESTYYMIDPKTGRYRDYSGCGNTLNCNHPVVRNLLLNCLRYWVSEMHVDGFRFDLASILGRGRDGSVLKDPPLLEMLAGDAVLSRTKLIAEAWDASGLYQVGSFPHWGRFAEWNGRFRDDLRKFVRGDLGMTALLATRLGGSSDLYEDDGRAPFHSVNFVTCHDGFTLGDLVSYERKHNEGNGEGNRDGLDSNVSWNCGVEGPTDLIEVDALRRRQVRNFATLLLMAQGVPMILAGDEFGRSQGGNNNAWCQDNEVSWIDWRLREQNADLFRFFRCLVRFRKVHTSLRRREYLERGHDSWVVWHGPKLFHADWSHESQAIAMHLLGLGRDDEIYVIANAAAQGDRWHLPELANGQRWRRFVDTSLRPPDDAVEPGAEPLLANQRAYDVAGRSVVVLVGR